MLAEKAERSGHGEEVLSVGGGGVCCPPSARGEQSHTGSWGNWKVWPENKPFFRQSPCFWHGHWRKFAGSIERNLRNRT